MNETFFGAVVGIGLSAVISLTVAITYSTGRGDTVTQCQTLGKIESRGKLYECSFKEVAK